jgi:glycosyltransferase involved in cell wall biosynthesis
VKVCCFSHLASADAPTGAEHSLALLARGLSRRGHDVAITAPGPWSLEKGLVTAGIEVQQIPVRVCWLVQSEAQPLVSQIARAVRYGLPDSGGRAISIWLERRRPDVVHVNCLPHLRAARAGHRLGVPVVWHLREILPPGPRRRWFALRLQRYASKIVAVSAAVAGWVDDEGLGDRVRVVHNAVEMPTAIPSRSDARRELDLPAEVPVVGLYSQLVPHKGGPDFVRAAHDLADEHPLAHFVIAGRGESGFVAALRRAANDGPAAERIHLLPPHPTIWSLLAATDVVAVPTTWPDPLPRVVMEAMASGLPVVAYDGGGVPEMISDGDTGTLAASGDVAALAGGIGRLLADGALRQQMGERARERAQRLFTVDGHVDAMERVLAEAAAVDGS